MIWRINAVTFHTWESDFWFKFEGFSTSSKYKQVPKRYLSVEFEKYHPNKGWIFFIKIKWIWFDNKIWISLKICEESEMSDYVINSTNSQLNLFLFFPDPQRFIHFIFFLATFFNVFLHILHFLYLSTISSSFFL